MTNLHSSLMFGTHHKHTPTFGAINHECETYAVMLLAGNTHFMHCIKLLLFFSSSHLNSVKVANLVYQNV